MYQKLVKGSKSKKKKKGQVWYLLQILTEDDIWDTE